MATTKKQTKDALPKKIGGYTPTQMLGHGAMGNVWLCHDESLDRMVIVKQMVPKLLDQDSFILRFQQEATILAHLNHPAIVVPYALWKESDGQLSLSMEFVMGKNLREILDVCKQPPVWVVMAILYEIFLALSVVHRAGIVHRDLKPANMMVDKDGRIRLLDFGVAHMDKVYEDDPTLTMAGSQIGTAAYMSPEQAVGSEATPASDLFSMGIIASEMLIGENLFRGKDFEETRENILKMKFKLEVFPNDVPKPLRKFVLKLLNKRASKRPSSACDAANELADLMREYPRDMTPYIAEWADTVNEDQPIDSVISPKPQKTTFKYGIGFILGVIVAAIAFIGVQLAI